MKKYYSLKKILEKDCLYSIIIGERSNGKSYSVLEKMLKNYLETGEEGAYVRRWDTDLQSGRCKTLFDSLMCNGKKENVIEKLSHGMYDRVVYYNRNFYLAFFDEKTKTTVKSPNPFVHTFALNNMEHDKGSSFPKTTTIFFDEFLTRSSYLPQEFVIFQNVISTIRRDRTNVKIFMAANTVELWSPYFDEMGLYRIKTMKPNSIDVYTYNNPHLTVAVEYTESVEKTKEENAYSAFDNPRLKMISGGEWEIDIYPHAPFDIERKNILYTSYIKGVEKELYSVDYIFQNECMFGYIHKKTTPLLEETTDIIFQLDKSPRENFITSASSLNKVWLIFKKLYNDNKIFYENNKVGEMIRIFLKEFKRQ